MQRLLLPVSLILVSLSGLSHAQWARGIIHSSRSIDWSGAGVVGGIPSRSTVCATLTSGASSAQINSAITNCPAGQVVYLSAGTYNLSAGITIADKSDVTLRGAGPLQTILNFTGPACSQMGGTNNVCVTTASPLFWEGSASTQPGGDRAADWLAGYSQGTTQVTLSRISNLSAGDYLILDQKNDVTDTGGAVVCDVIGVCSSAALASGRNIGGVNYSQQQIVKVTALEGTGPYVATITPGLYATNWSSAKSPGAFWTGSVSGIGIEDLTLNHSGSSFTKSGLLFINAHNCWVKNVRSLNSKRNHIWLYLSSHIQVQDSYFYGAVAGASQSYGVEWYGTGDNLVINNIFQHIASPVVAGPSAGSVFAYNYSTDMHYTSPATWMQGPSGGHDAGGHMNLYEGNETNQWSMDNLHGAVHLATYFRNQMTGTEPGKTANTIPFELNALNRFVNVVGNVLGTPAYHVVYENSSVGTRGDPNRSIYLLGYSGALENSAAGIPYDPTVAGTLLRWGNYDTVTGGVRFNCSEVPAANPCPTNNSLPPSLFLRHRPSFWVTPFGTPPWPAIGPEVTGGNDPTGRVFWNPAHLCHLNTAVDPDYGGQILRFDATNCYPSNPPDQLPPAPPENLQQR